MHEVLNPEGDVNKSSAQYVPRLREFMTEGHCKKFHTVEDQSTLSSSFSSSFSGKGDEMEDEHLNCRDGLNRTQHGKPTDTRW